MEQTGGREASYGALETQSRQQLWSRHGSIEPRARPAKSNDWSIIHQWANAWNNCSWGYVFTSIRVMEQLPRHLGIPLYLHGQMGGQSRRSAPSLGSSLGSSGTSVTPNGWNLNDPVRELLSLDHTYYLLQVSLELVRHNTWTPHRTLYLWDGTVRKYLVFSSLHVC